MEQDREPFLHEKDSYEDFPESNVDLSELTHARPRTRKFQHAFFFHLLLVSLYTIISIVVISWQVTRSSQPPDVLPNLKIKYESHVQTFTDSTYSGLPSNELDKAWDNLMTPMRIRVSSEELKQYNQTSVPLPEGGGNLVWLGAFHQLHCVRLLRQFVYLDYYVKANLTEEDLYHIKSHADHCLEVLRQAAICAGDTSLTTVKWDKGKQSPGVDLEGNSIHWCVDWEQLMDSTAFRVVGEEEFSSLENPFNKL